MVSRIRCANQPVEAAITDAGILDGMTAPPDHATTKPGRSLAPWRWALHWQILLGLAAGVGLGLLAGYLSVASVPADLAPDARVRAARAALEGRGDIAAYRLVGDLFMNGLRLIVVPIVMSSLITAMAGLGARAGFARLGAKTLAYYLSTSLVAILVGLSLANWIRPGVTDPERPVLDLSATRDFATRFADEGAQIAARIGDRDAASFLDTIRELVPGNLFAAAADNGRLLGLITVSLLFGYFLSRLGGRPREVLEAFWQGVYDITLRITDVVLRFAPLGIAALIATTLAEAYGRLALDGRLADFVQVLVLFAVTVLGGLAFHAGVFLPLVVRTIGGRSPGRHYRDMAPALVTAFSTASSAATLPVTLDCVERRAGVSNRVAGFVLPLGATVNMDGTALYECVAAMFIAQAYGIDLSFGQQFLVVAIALLTSIGVAGVPQASLVAIVVILEAVGVPLEGMALILVVDRVLDMARTAVNVFSDSCGAAVIARTEGESPPGADGPEPA
jgi:Na+/H+-dicarboxylate symporter